MERIKSSIEDIKYDLKKLIYDTSTLIGYIHMDFDKELPDNDYWDKQKRSELYQKANKFLEALNEATFVKEYGDITKRNVINEIEGIYFEATNRGKQPKDTNAWVDNENKDDEEEEV